MINQPSTWGGSDETFSQLDGALNTTFNLIPFKINGTRRPGNNTKTEDLYVDADRGAASAELCTESAILRPRLNIARAP
jgi:hypothetical protein